MHYIKQTRCSRSCSTNTFIINWLSVSWFVEISPKHHKSQAVRAKELRRILRECSPPTTCHIWHATCHVSHVTCDVSHVTRQMWHVTCHVSCVTCHVSHAMSHMSHFFYFYFLLDIMVKLIGRVSVINGASTSCF